VSVVLQIYCFTETWVKWQTDFIVLEGLLVNGRVLSSRQKNGTTWWGIITGHPWFLLYSLWTNRQCLPFTLTRTKTRAPLPECRINNALIRFVPSCQDTRAQFVDVLYPSFSDIACSIISCLVVGILCWKMSYYQSIAIWCLVTNYASPCRTAQRFGAIADDWRLYWWNGEERQEKFQTKNPAVRGQKRHFVLRLREESSWSSCWGLEEGGDHQGNS